MFPSIIQLRILPFTGTAALLAALLAAVNNAPAQLSETEFNDSERAFLVCAGIYEVSNHSQSARCFRNLAGAGDVSAQFILGVMFDKGEGVVQDKREAAKWYRKAAEQGLANAQFNLGVMYDKGEGVSVNKAEAAMWYRLAAARNVREAQFNLGMLYSRGEGVAKDKTKAMRLYLLAAEQGCRKAQYNLGLMYDKGDGVQVNKKEAVKWYLRAARQGCAKAQNNLGAIYNSGGGGVPRDFYKAYMWFTLASYSGDENAAVRAALIEGNLTDGELEKAKATVRKLHLTMDTKYGVGR